MDARNSCFSSSLNNIFSPQSPPLQPESQPQQSNFHSFSHQLPSHPSYSIFNQQYPFNIQNPFSHIPYQTSNLQPLKTQQSKSVQKERNPNWSKEEYEALCQAWLRISEDAAIGTEQSRYKLWDRIKDEFNIILGKQSNRISSALMNRWSSIQAQLNKYSGFLRTVENSPSSGYNVEDSIGAAKQLYYDSQGQHFKLDGCWLILKDTSIWFHYTKEQVEKKQRTKLNRKRNLNVDVDVDINENEDPSYPPSRIGTPSSATTSISLDDDDSPVTQVSYEPRPVGRKMAKKNCTKRNEKQLVAVNLFVEEFSNLRKDQKEISEREIQAKQEQERLKLEAKLVQEQMKIAAKKEQLVAKREQEQLKLEKDIMMTDPNLVTTEEGRAWIIAQQKAIWARVTQGGTGDGANVSEG